MKNKFWQLSLISLLFFIACNKPENILQGEGVSINNKSNARKRGSADSAEYYLNMDKPTRDAIIIKRKDGILPATKAIRTGDRKLTAEEQAQIAKMVCKLP